SRRPADDPAHRYPGAFRPGPRGGGGRVADQRRGPGAAVGGARPDHDDEGLIDVPELNDAPSIIDVPGGKVIAEHVGRVATGTEAMSVAHMTAPAGWFEPAQRPEFDEVTLVVAGTVLVEHDGGT